MLTEHDTLLGSCRVLDLTDEKGHLCGKVLGDFGADVIKVEKPGGDPSRNIGPFYRDIPHPEKSLFWFSTNTSKRGITLDIGTPDGREIFKKLVETTDFVVESFESSYMDDLGLGYSELIKIKPDIIMTSITPFGQTGPYAHYQSTDLVGCAMGGLVRLLGDLGRPPVRMSCDPQAYFHAGLQGALGSMMAHYHRALTGEGQHVDVSMQEAVTLALMHAVEIYEIMRVNVIGMGQFFVSVRPAPQPPLFTRLIMPCKDGFVFATFGGGGFGGQVQSSRALVEWANAEGMLMEFKDSDFTQWDASTLTQEESDRRWAVFGDFLKTKTKAELYEESVKRGIMLAPCNTIEDVSKNAQLEARGFWEKVEHPELGETIIYPGAPLKIEETPWRIQRRAPLVGEHNEEVYVEEMGFSKEQMTILKANGAI
ncbi:MAG: CoA transferase [Dehalococcoidia bacterium]|nr:CoA transferase [Dehalococcoidia bacterium]